MLKRYTDAYESYEKRRTLPHDRTRRSTRSTHRAQRTSYSTQPNGRAVGDTRSNARRHMGAGADIPCQTGLSRCKSARDVLLSSVVTSKGTIAHTTSKAIFMKYSLFHFKNVKSNKKSSLFSLKKHFFNVRTKYMFNKYLINITCIINVKTIKNN